ncbi:MAG: YceI family protein [Ilumatobacteraceae bacterium]
MSLPLQPGTWIIDATHSSVEFTVRHLGISKLRGRFSTVDASARIGSDLDSSSLAASIDLSSIDTGNADRDGHLRTTDFFDIATHPQLTFASKSITAAANGTYRVTGSLTINGITHVQDLDIGFNGTEVYPVDNSTHAGFTATGSLRRSDYGVKFDVPLAAGGFAIGDNVGLELNIQLYPAP